MPKSNFTDIWKVKKPFPNANGKWIRLKKFDQHKSFGFFECLPCKKHWTTAHARTEYRQGCKKCNREYYPRYMWKNNSDTDSSSDDGIRKDRKPHDSKRCEACRKGMCISDEF